MKPDDLHIFASLTTTIIAPLLQVLRDNVGTVVNGARPIGLAMLALWMAVVGADVAGHHKTINQVRRELFIAAICLGTLVSGAIYMEWVGNFFATGLPNSLIALLGLPGDPSAGIDKILITEIKAGILVYDKLPWGFSTLPMAFGVLIYLVFACAMAAATYSVFTLAEVTNLVCIYVGPVALVLAAIPWTRKIAAGWLTALIGGVAVQFMSMAILAFTAKGQLDVVKTLVDAVTAQDANSTAMIILLMRSGVIILIGYLLIKQVIPVAHAMAGGVYHQTQGLIGAAFGPANSAVNAATSGVTSALSSVGSNAARQMGGGAVRAAAARGGSGARGSGFRSPAPTGKSLSGSTSTP